MLLGSEIDRPATVTAVAVRSVIGDRSAAAGGARGAGRCRRAGRCGRRAAGSTPAAGTELADDDAPEQAGPADADRHRHPAAAPVADQGHADRADPAGHHRAVGRGVPVRADPGVRHRTAHEDRAVVLLLRRPDVGPPRRRTPAAPADGAAPIRGAAAPTGAAAPAAAADAAPAAPADRPAAGAEPSAPAAPAGPPPPGPPPPGALPKDGTMPAGLGGTITGTVRAASSGEPVGRILVDALRPDAAGSPGDRRLRGHPGRRLVPAGRPVPDRLRAQVLRRRLRPDLVPGRRRTRPAPPRCPPPSIRSPPARTW